MQNIKYIVVARQRDKEVLAAFFNGPDAGRLSQFESTVTRVLSSVKIAERPKLTVMDKDLGHINYDSDADCVYFVVTAQNYPQRTAFSLMEELKSGFKEQWAHEVDDALPRSLTKGTKRFLSSLASKFDNLEAVDKLSGVRAQVDEVTGIMNDNVTQMLKQGENLDVLSDKTNDLNYEASKFHKQSTTLKRQAWWKSQKLTIIIVLIVLVVLAIVLIPIIIWAKGKADDKKKNNDDDDDNNDNDPSPTPEARVVFLTDDGDRRFE